MRKDVRMETVENFLESAYYWEKRANRIADDIARLRSQAEKATASYSLAPAHTAGNRRQDAMDAMIDKQKKYEAARKECDKNLEKIQFVISLLNDYVERTVCEYRYLSFYTPLDIALKLNYSVSNVGKINDKALLNLWNINEQAITTSGKGFF